MKTKKNIYLATLSYELVAGDIEKVCKAMGIKNGYESDAYCWLEDGRTEKEIIDVLRKLGYDIPQETVGSEKIKFDSTIQD